MLLHTTFAWLAVLPCAWAGVTTDAGQAANQTFDYIIIGGGTAGLALAGRLSEEPDVSVLVLEAGPDNRTSPLESVVDFPIAMGSALDWSYETVDLKTIHGCARLRVFQRERTLRVYIEVKHSAGVHLSTVGHGREG